MSAERSSRDWRPLVYLLPAWIGLAWLVSKAHWYWDHRPDLQYGWVVLILCGYLIWDGWEQQPPLRLRFHWSQPILLLVSLGSLFVFQIYHAAFGLMPAALVGLAIGILLLVTANLHYVYGMAGIRHFGFGFAFILIALPMPSAIQGPLVSSLQSVVAGINVEVLRVFGIPAQQIGSLIHLPGGTVGIDEACSGIRSLQSTIMATLFIGYLTIRSRFLQLALFGLGMLLAVAGNILRSLFLSFMANARGIDSLKEYHDAAGWSVLGFTVVGVCLVAWGLNRLEKSIDLLKLQDQAK
ncbi:MAG: exosortase/archaeosortase family protein [Candidatus Omnitrophica bacterium]|nr:exosortase/archaeosortase family protein [Candidatus Omnitrophota bacterium]